MKLTIEQRDERRARLAEKGIFCSCPIEEPVRGCVICDTTQEELEEMVREWEKWNPNTNDVSQPWGDLLKSDLYSPKNKQAVKAQVAKLVQGGGLQTR